jgi:chaperonin cofactor prefoldin
MQQTQEMNMTNKVNIEFLMKQLDKALKDIEKLKDKQREFANGNGNY